MKQAMALALVLALILAGCTSESQPVNPSNEIPVQQQAAQEPLPPPQPPVNDFPEVPEQPIQREIPPEPNMMPPPQAMEQQEYSWGKGDIAIAGNYADADIIEYEPGKFRMYYGLQPEVSGFKGQIYSATSSDGITWTEESGERMDGATFPSVLKLQDGKFRMYYQSAGVIKSSISTDGLKWTAESGTRIGTQNKDGLNLERVGSPTVVKHGDEYLMAYFGAIAERYQGEMVPNPETHLFLWATSADGLKFETKSIAFDSRNPDFKGWVDGPEFVQWGDELRLYFWGYGGVYHINFEETFSEDAVFDYLTPQDNPLVQFPSNPPGDPTLANINGQWLMYYGQHPEGIYYVTYLGE